MKFAHNFFQGRAITMDCQDYITELVERKKGQHLQREERGAIQHLKNAGYTNRAIARAIGCSPTTVGNELKRGTPPRKSSPDTRQGAEKRPTRLGCILPTPNAPGQRVFSRCAAPFFLGIRQYSCEKMSCSTQKFLAAGHIGSWKNTP